MAIQEMLSLSKRDLEEYFDSVKVQILKALVDEGHVESKVAEKWTQDHTVLVRDKTIFRTISNLWQKEEAVDGFYLSIAKVINQEINQDKTNK